MSERPENRPGGARRGGPLRDDTEQSEKRREEPRRDSDEDATQRIPADDATRQIPREEDTSGGRDRSSDTQEFEAPKEAPRKTSAKKEESRGKARPARNAERDSGRGAAASGGYSGYSTGYSEVLREREEYLRDIYGGVDWLASFVGLIFTLLFAALLGVGAVAFLLVPLELQESLESGRLTSSTITGFAVVAAVLFLSFLLGGYVSGRMARYDGGRNGAMVLLWTILVAALLLLLSGVLGQVISGTLAGGLVRDALSFGATTIELLRGLGVSGAVITGGVILAALLGGMFGGRMGSRYHREIDYTP